LFLNPFQNLASAGEKIALMNVASGVAPLPSIDPELYDVKTVSGRFRTKSGTTRTYTLYVPEKNSVLSTPPYPLVILLHGFLMTGHQHSNNAKFFAQKGFVALTPDMTKILLGDDNRMHNVADILDQISGLIKESKNKSSPLYGLIDASHIGIAGNSAGGAVCLELLLEAQKANIPIQAMCSLDGVPWDRTKASMEKLKPVNILSLRAEPGLCNYYSRMLSYLQLLKFPYNDVKLNGAHHCDVENPTTLGCRCVCGTSTAKYRALFQRLTYLYFRDILRPSAHAINPTETFADAVTSLKKEGIVVAKLDQLEQIELAGNTQVQ
jgi:Chlorophyllase enzyme